jgi:hypothetical protein
MDKVLVDRYIAMRNHRQFNISLFWEMYKSNKGMLTKAEHFSIYFLNSVQINGNFEVRTERDRTAILESIDSKLGLTVLYDKEGKFIRVC